MVVVAAAVVPSVVEAELEVGPGAGAVVIVNLEANHHRLDDKG
jgi:hypothetical protein